MKRIAMLNFGGRSFEFHNRAKSEAVDLDFFHAHQGLELLLIHEGVGQLVLNQQLIPLRTGTLVVFQPFQLHRVRMQASSVTYVRSMTVFDPHLLDRYIKPFPQLEQFYHHIWKEQLPVQTFELGIFAERFNELYGQFAQSLQTETEPNLLENYILFLLELFSLFRKVYLQQAPGTLPPASGRKLGHIEAAMEWVERHFREPFDLERLAAELHLTTYHLSHLFKESTGSTISDYVTARRMKEACLLLTSTDLPINRIAYQIGRFSTSYFSTLFKRQMDVTPREYREQINDATYH